MASDVGGLRELALPIIGIQLGEAREVSNPGMVLSARESAALQGGSRRVLALDPGAMRVWAMPSTGEIDFFDTIVDPPALREAWYRDYVIHPFKLRDGSTVLQGAVDMLHDSSKVIGFVRDWQDIESGILAGITIPGVTDREREAQAMVQAGTLTGLSILFVETAEKKERAGDRQITRYTAIRLPRVTLAAGPATPGTYFQRIEMGEMRERMIRDLTGRHAWPGVDLIGRQRQAGEEAGVPDFTTENGFLWAAIRPEEDFTSGTMRYQNESPEGVCWKNGTTKDAPPRIRLQAIGFNESLWNADQAALYLLRNEETLWQMEDSMHGRESTESMPQARQVSFIDRLWRRWRNRSTEKTGQEQQTADVQAPAETVTQEESELKPDEVKAMISESITAALTEFKAGLPQPAAPVAPLTQEQTDALAAVPELRSTIGSLTTKLQEREAAIGGLTAKVNDLSAALGRIPGSGVQTEQPPPATPAKTQRREAFVDERGNPAKPLKEQLAAIR